MRKFLAPLAAAVVTGIVAVPVWNNHKEEVAAATAAVELKEKVAEVRADLVEKLGGYDDNLGADIFREVRCGQTTDSEYVPRLTEKLLEGTRERVGYSLSRQYSDDKYLDAKPDDFEDTVEVGTVDGVEVVCARSRYM